MHLQAAKFVTDLPVTELRGYFTNIPQKVAKILTCLEVSKQFFLCCPTKNKMRQKYSDTEKCLCLSYFHYDKIHIPLD